MKRKCTCRCKGFENITEYAALTVAEQGKLLKIRMDKAQMNENIVSAAWISFGFERLDQVKYAVMEKLGSKRN